MSPDGDDELGRPRYQSSATPGERAAGGAAPSSGAAVRKTAPAAVTAMAFAAVGWLLPVFGGLLAIRRARVAMHQIEAAGGELDGVPLALWARRLGWAYVIGWSVGLSYVALRIYIDVTNVLVTGK